MMEGLLFVRILHTVVSGDSEFILVYFLFTGYVG